MHQSGHASRPLGLARIGLGEAEYLELPRSSRRSSEHEMDDLLFRVGENDGIVNVHLSRRRTPPTA